MKGIRGNVSDRLFRGVLFTFSLCVIGLVVALLYVLVMQSSASINRFGLSFLVGQTWDPVHNIFGVLPFVYGTVVSSLIALVIATIVGVATAVLLSLYGGLAIVGPIAFLVELLAAIPSVVYGLWGIFVLAPWLRANVEPWLGAHLGFIPLFSGTPYGLGMLAAGLILAIMILPTITSIVRDILRSVPIELREGAMALGATRQEMISMAALPYARTGIVGAVMLGLGRALGETLAVTMVIGNRPQISASLFAPGYSMASVIANEFTEATSHLYLSALYEVGLVLFVVTVLFYAFARLLVWRVGMRVRA